MTTVSQEAREAAENFINAHGWLCEEDWSLVLEADREVIVKFFHKFEQSIRQSAERAFEERERKLREALKGIETRHGWCVEKCRACYFARQALKETPDAQ